MVSGSYFGEIEILFKRRRDFSVICEMDSELYYLSRYVDIFCEIYSHILGFREYISERIPSYCGPNETCGKKKR